MLITIHKNQAGLTLLELMIAVTLGLLTTAAVAYLFISSSSQARFDDLASGLQENGRFSMHFLADDLRMANFWGYEFKPTNITTLSGSNVNVDEDFCGIEPYHWKTGASAEGGIAQISIDSSSDSNAWSTSGCGSSDPSSLPKVGTKMLVIKRVSGTPYGLPSAASVAITANTPYLLVGAKDSSFYSSSSTTTRTLTNAEHLWEYMTRVYYVSADNQLCRKVLGSSEAFTTECLLEGVEDMRIMFGIDTFNNDGLADKLTADPDTLPEATTTFNPYNSAVSARICLLMRSRDEVRSYTDPKTYSVCGTTTTPGDGFLRRVFDKSVDLRNTTALRIFN